MCISIIQSVRNNNSIDEKYWASSLKTTNQIDIQCSGPNICHH
jgi:hypothetical protein